MELRAARPSDLDSIVSFTRNTFEWGDYVADEFLAWLDDPKTQVFVATDEARAVALVRVSMLSPKEAWLASARVSPEHRGRGIASRLNDLCMRWARDRGAATGRLAIEEWNEAARRQVLGLGFRVVSRWNSARLQAPDHAEPRPGLELADPAEAEPAYGSWATGELARRAHDLFPIGWTWRRMAIEDLRRAAQNGSLLACPEGWIIVHRDNGSIRVPWLQTAHSEAPSLLASLLALGPADIHTMLPSVPWLDETLERAGFELNPLEIFEKETELRA